MQYQPEVDLASGAITGMEAMGSGWEVLAAAAAELSTWRALPHPAMHEPRQMWVTATASQLLEVDVVERIGALIAEHSLDRDCLGLQVGEDILATGGRFAPVLLADLREAGVALSIAGIGSWYAAMAAMGLSRSAVSVEAVTAIAADCVLVDTEWRLRFEPADRPAAETAFHISYVVRNAEGNPQILLAISHEDEQQLLANLGLGGPGER